MDQRRRSAFIDYAIASDKKGGDIPWSTTSTAYSRPSSLSNTDSSSLLDLPDRNPIVNSLNTRCFLCNIDLSARKQFSVQVIVRSVRKRLETSKNVSVSIGVSTLSLNIIWILTSTRILWRAKNSINYNRLFFVFCFCPLLPISLWIPKVPSKLIC